MAKGRKTKLTNELIELVCKYIKLRTPWVQIAALVEVDPKTLRNWRDRGMKAKTGIYRKFVDAVDRAEATWYTQTTKVLTDAILGKGKQTTRKVILENGIPVKTEIIEKTLLPDGRLALEALGRSHPELWGRYETLRIETDLRSEADAMGLDLEEIIAALAKVIEGLLEEGQENLNPKDIVALVEAQGSEETE